MRIWVEKSICHRVHREHREDISYYGIMSKGGWKIFCRNFISERSTMRFWLKSEPQIDTDRHWLKHRLTLITERRVNFAPRFWTPDKDVLGSSLCYGIFCDFGIFSISYLHKWLKAPEISIKRTPARRREGSVVRGEKSEEWKKP
jgi:hypothetical protein